MTDRILVTALAIVIGMAAAFAQVEKPSGKPVKQSLVAVDSIPPPGTLTDMVSSADGVVIARATGKRRLKRGQRDDLFLESTHSLIIEKVIKYSAAIPVAGEVLDLDVAGGTKEYPSYVRSEVILDWDPILPNHRYLIFVRFVSNDFGERLVPCWSAAGIFDITGNAARSLNQRFRRYNDKASAQFLEDVKAVANGAKRP